MERGKVRGRYQNLVEVLPAVRTLTAMHGPPETHQPTDVSVHGKVWTDARGQATGTVPRDAGPQQAELEYALRAIDGESGVRVLSGLRHGRFTIATDQPPMKGRLADQSPKGGVEMSRTIALMLALAVVAAGVLAAGSSGARQEQRTIGLVRGGGGFLDSVQQGAQSAAAALGDRLTVLNADGTAQIGAIRSLIAQHVDAIAVDPDDQAVKPALAQAHAAGIATLSVETAIPGSGSVWVNQSGPAQYAHALADALATQMGRKGQYAIVGEQDQFPIADQWQRLIKSYFVTQYPRMKLVKVIRGTGGGDEAEVATVKQFIAAHPKLRGLVGVTPTEGYMVAEAIIQARKIGKIFASGNGGGCPPIGDPLQRSFVRRGAEQIVCIGDPAKLGYLSIWAADHLVSGQTFVPGSYDVGGPVGTVQYVSQNEELRLGQPLTITKANLGNYSGKS